MRMVASDSAGYRLRPWPLAMVSAALASDIYSPPEQQDVPITNCAHCNMLNYHPDYQSNPNYSDLISRKLPGVFQENAYQSNEMDKIFTSAWLSDSEVVFGTKCNKMVVLNVHTNKMFYIPSVFDAASTQERLVPMAGHCSGIHSIAINQSQTMLAVGAGDSSKTILLYSLPDFRPLAQLVGHTDMIFALQWLSDTVLVSGSRDKTVKEWLIPHLEPPADISQLPSISFQSSRMEHRDKVRDLVADKSAQQIHTLSADGYVKVWDVSRQMDPVSSVPLVHTNEIVCMALDQEHHIAAVGSQSHISLIDPRIKSVVQIFDSLDDGWGVRSLQIRHGLATIGGGLGRISFFDLRNQKYQIWESNALEQVHPADPRMVEDTLGAPPQVSTARRRAYLEASSGWLSRDVIYMNHFQGALIRNAIYTLSYDPSGTRLFAAGGPLQLNLKGSYIGLWQ
jgi:WD repeat-containing protein 40A